MRTVVFQLLLLLTTLAWAGGEVPWPKNFEQDVAIRELGGVWVSQNFNDPQIIYFFAVERATVEVNCALTLRLYEIDAIGGKMIAAGNTPFCSSAERQINFMMYDNNGRARNWVSIVGLTKPSDSTTPGVQNLGLTQFKVPKVEEDKVETASDEKILQDTFYKVSN